MRSIGMECSATAAVSTLPDEVSRIPDREAPLRSRPGTKPDCGTSARAVKSRPGWFDVPEKAEAKASD